jgi:anti-sigma regulatory factor (Ser/Thr protein kinase)
VFPGQETALQQVRYWLAELLPDGQPQEDVLTVAAELAANALQHTASGGHGFFAVEVTWHAYPPTLRIAVADGGAPTGPELPGMTQPTPLGGEPPRPAPLPDGSAGRRPPVAGPPPGHGRGLRLVQALAARCGVCGDHRGRLVWADLRWAGPGPAGDPDGYQAAIADIRTVLAARYPEASIWFGRSTMRWWALASGPGAGWLLSADSPVDLAQLLDVYRVTQRPARRRSRGRHGLTGRHTGPHAGQHSWTGVRSALSPLPWMQPLARAAARLDGR